MPTFTTIALENLLEHRKPDSSNFSTFKHPLPSSLTKPRNDLTTQNDGFTRSRNPLNHVFRSPSLYTTPEPTPILDNYSSSRSVSSSPYVFNRKSRGGGGGGVGRKIDGFEVDENRDVNENHLVVGGVENENCDEEDKEVDDFLDPRCVSLSVASSSEFNDLGRLLGFENVTSHVGELMMLLKRHIYGQQGNNINIFADNSSLAVNPSYIRSWLDLMSKTPRVAPFSQRTMHSSRH